MLAWRCECFCNVWVGTNRSFLSVLTHTHTRRYTYQHKKGVPMDLVPDESFRFCTHMIPDYMCQPIIPNYQNTHTGTKLVPSSLHTKISRHQQSLGEVSKPSRYYTALLPIRELIPDNRHKRKPRTMAFISASLHKVWLMTTTSHCGHGRNRTNQWHLLLIPHQRERENAWDTECAIPIH